MKKEEVYLNLFDLMFTTSFWKVVSITLIPAMISVLLYLFYLLVIERGNKHEK